MPGLIREWKATVPSSLTTAISMIRSPWKARTPVVSTSTTAHWQASSTGLVSGGGVARVQRPSLVRRNRGSGASNVAAMRSAVWRFACTIPSTSRTIARLAAGPLCRNETARAVSEDDGTAARPVRGRSEEHTSELQSRLHLVCRLLLEKKKKTTTYTRPPYSVHTSV